MRGSEAITGLGTRKAGALLAYLVMHKRPFSRERLADLLWDDRPQEQASANLRSLLSGLRRHLKPYLIITRQDVMFNHASDYWLDVTEFSQQLTTNYQLPATSYQKLISAIGLYQGNFLEGFYIREAHRFEEWATMERERLKRLAVNTLRQIVDDCLDNGRYPQGLQYADQLIHLDNLSEHAHRQKMLLLARSGQRNAALQQYDACCHLLDDELGVKPAAATTALHERLRGLQFPPPYNLPATATPFVGRERELTDIQRFLANPTERLLTLFGPGGMGKTRLAIEAAQRIVKERPGQFFDGVFYVSLAAITAIQQLPDQIAHAIGFTYQGAEPRETQLVAYLKSKEMLLVLDNFEQFLGVGETGADLIARILHEASQITMLVTSRERLNLYEEALFEIAGLDVPPEQAEQPEQYNAVALFLQRIQRLRRDYAPTADEMAAIVRACRLLGGMPLAIELAAGWVRQHSFAEIESQIKESFDFLKASYRNVPQRQRSLRAVFDHSWQLLMAQEQVIFTELAVFPDSFNLAAAQSVVDNLVDDGPIVALVDKSLLQRQPDGRFQVHPILHQYAVEKLAEDGGLATAVSQRHSDYFMIYLAGQGSGESIEQRAAIKLEQENIRAAWEWAVSQGDVQTIEQAAPILNGFFSAESWFQEGVDTFQFALDALTRQPDAGQAPILCELYRCKARQHIYIGQLAEARRALDEALAYLVQLDDPEQKSAVLGNLAITRFYAGDYAGADQLAEEGLALSEAVADQDGIAFSVNFLGSCAKAQGDFTRSAHYFERAVDAYHQLEDGIGEAMALHNLGNLAQATQDFDRAQMLYQQCGALFKTHNHVHGMATTSANAGRLALQMSEFEAAQQLLSEALALKEQINDERGMAVALVGLGAVAAATGELAQARQHLAQGLALAQKSGDVKLMLEGVVVTAVYAKNGNQSQTAADLVVYALGHPATVQEVRQQAEKVLEELGLDVATAVTNPPIPPEQSVDDLVLQLLNQMLSTN